MNIIFKLIIYIMINENQNYIIVNFIPSVISSNFQIKAEYKGAVDCDYCHGDGIIKSNKPCTICVLRTGNCQIFKNTGLNLIKPNKICKSIWGKDR